MTGLALLARAQGHQVSGMDAQIYPPMSTILEQEDIQLINRYDPAQLPAADTYIVGNVITRGMPVVEKILDEHLPHISAPQWLAENILRLPRIKTVCAVAGTHGKTTTTALLTHLCLQADLAPGYLIGGKALNFNYTASLGAKEIFILEADEYDSAFFDKRSKFVHYRPDILIINNLEYDHADIFPDMAALTRAFCHLLRTVPEAGHVFYQHGNPAIDAILAAECRAHRHRLCEVEDLPQARQAAQQTGDLSVWAVGAHQQGWRIERHADDACVPLDVQWNLPGRHNAANLLAAVAAARQLGVVDPKEAARSFRGVERRLQLLGVFGEQSPGIEVISDFAHHPTAIAATLQALKGPGRLFAVIALASNSMRLGVHADQLKDATADADEVLWFTPKPLDWDPAVLLRAEPGQDVHTRVDALAARLKEGARGGDRVVLMSNSGLSDLTDAVCQALGPEQKS